MIPIVICLFFGIFITYMSSYLMKTYEQKKMGLNPICTKGVVIEDGIHVRQIIFISEKLNLT